MSVAGILVLIANDATFVRSHIEQHLRSPMLAMTRNVMGGIGLGGEHRIQVTGADCLATSSFAHQLS
jgi:hypothetical protein